MTAPIRQLTSCRLILRQLKITDAPRLARITNDPLVTRKLMKTACSFTVHDARKIIMNAHRKRLPVWGIDDGTLVGLIGLAGEFGLWLERRVWGRGYGAEASRLVIDHAFAQLKMTALHSNPISDNRASCHLMEKLGFRDAGRSKGFCKQRRKLVSLRRYELKKSFNEEGTPPSLSSSSGQARG